MIANTAFLAALTVFLWSRWLAGELRFLAPYKAGSSASRASRLRVAILLRVPEPVRRLLRFARWLFLRDAGRKLAHLDRQLGRVTPPDDLRQHLQAVRSQACGGTSILVRRA